jgi:hypothetical protein
MINWKDPLKEMPKDGEYVACMQYHWKHCWPLSAEIIFGEVESYINEDGHRIARVNTRDFTGGGSYCWSFSEYRDSDSIVAWTYANEFKRPDFLRHNPHWGSEK